MKTFLNKSRILFSAILLLFVATPQLSATVVDFTTIETNAGVAKDGTFGSTDIADFDINFKVYDSGNGTSGQAIQDIGSDTGLVHYWSGGTPPRAIEWAVLKIYDTVTLAGSTSEIKDFNISSFYIYNGSGGDINITVSGYEGSKVFVEVIPGIPGMYQYNKGAATVTHTQTIPNGVWTQVTLTDFNNISWVEMTTTSNVLMYVNRFYINNDIPEVTSSAITTGTEDVAYSYTLGASDGDNDALNWSALNKPSWLSFGASATISTITDENITSPGAVAVANNGDIYFIDALPNNNPNIIKKYSNGIVTTLLASGLSMVEDIAIDSNNNLYISDSNAYKIFKYDGANLTTVVETNSSNNERPVGVAISSNGHVYFTVDNGSGTSKLQKYDGTTLSTLIDSGLNSPRGLAVNGNNIYIADTYNNAIKKYDGTNITTVIDTGLNRPMDVILNSDGDLYIANGGNYNNIKKYSGTTLSTIATGFEFPTMLSLDANGDIYVADGWTTNTLKKVTLATALTGTPTNSDVGVHDVNLTVTDGTATVPHNFTITVACASGNCGSTTTTPINGTCGASNGMTLLLADITHQCSTGTASGITSNSTTHTWSCNGIDAGTTANCSATIPIGSISNNIESIGSSALAGTTSTIEDDSQILTATTTNEDNENIIIKAELPTDANSEIRTKHSITIGGKKTEATSKLEASVDIKSDKSVETKAEIGDSNISVIAKPDGTAEHTVTLQSGKSSKATSDVIGAQTEIDENGTVATMAGDVNATEPGYVIKAVAITKADGTTITRFIKVNTADETDVTVLGNTVTTATPFEAGNIVEIKDIGGTLFIKTLAPLDANLVIE